MQSDQSDKSITILIALHAKHNNQDIRMRAFSLKTIPILSNYIFGIMRLILAVGIIASICFLNDCIAPLIFVNIVRRYFISLANLFWLKVALWLLKLDIETDGFSYLTKKTYNQFDVINAQRLHFGSGYVGTSNFRGPLSTLFFMMQFNPIFVRIIECHEDQCTQGICIKSLFCMSSHVKIFYEKLGFTESLLASLNPYGFNPIVIKGRAGLRVYKNNKTPLKYLTSQQSINLRGPIIIYWPHINFQKQLCAQDNILNEINRVQINLNKQPLAFGISINSQIHSLQQILNKCLSNQKSKILVKYSRVIELRQIKMYAQFLNKSDQFDEFYNKNGYKIVEGNISGFVGNLNSILERQNNLKQQKIKKQKKVNKLHKLKLNRSKNNAHNQ